MSGKPSAAPEMAGFMVQIHRALHHLATCSAADSVGVETLDDVAKRSATGVEHYEQDKLTFADDGSPISDRSEALWNSLARWAAAWSSRDKRQEFQFSLTTNRKLSGKAVTMLSKQSRSADENRMIVAVLRDKYRALDPTKPSLAQQLINNVLAYDDEVLTSVISRTSSIATAGSLDLSLPQETKARLPFAGTGVCESTAYNSLVGWMHDCLLSSWFAKQPGWITKESFNRQVQATMMRLKREPHLPRAARLLPISDEARNNVSSYRFVSHLTLIDIEGDELDEEMNHYIRFAIERFRLLESGDYPSEHWADRGDRLKQHWKTIKRTACLERKNYERVEIGRFILLQASQLREELSGEPMTEAYLTIGHFHRLADEDLIAWHPDFVCKS